MMHSLRFKWVVTLLLTSLVGVFLVGLFAAQTTMFAYDRLRIEQSEAAFAEDMMFFYKQNGDWNGLEDWIQSQPALIKVRKTLLPPQMFALVNTEGKVVAGFGALQAGQDAPMPLIEKGTPLLVNNERVGTTVLAKGPPLLDPREQRYIDSVNLALVVGTIGATTVALLIGFTLSQHFLDPLRELTDAITALQQGNLEQRVQVRSNDELGMLGHAFNRLSTELHRANQLRKQMTADIAHDLRTPLMVISGYLEAMRDGTLKPTADRFDAMHQEAVLLKRLIEDLRTISLAEAGELVLMKLPVPPCELLEQVKGAFAPIAHEQQIALQVDVAADLPPVSIDRERMVQVLGNLLSNALRYTDSGGTITLQGRASQEHVQLAICDTGAGIAAENLPNIFERFYRADESRYQHEGESGLGLAIAKAIVEAHQGTIKAESSVGVGTTITITLPSTEMPEKTG